MGIDDEEEKLIPAQLPTKEEKLIITQRWRAWGEAIGLKFPIPRLLATSFFTDLGYSKRSDSYNILRLLKSKSFRYR